MLGYVLDRIEVLIYKTACKSCEAGKLSKLCDLKSCGEKHLGCSSVCISHSNAVKSANSNVICNSNRNLCRLKEELKLLGKSYYSVYKLEYVNGYSCTCGEVSVAVIEIYNVTVSERCGNCRSDSCCSLVDRSFEIRNVCKRVNDLVNLSLGCVSSCIYLVNDARTDSLVDRELAVSSIDLAVCGFLDGSKLACKRINDELELVIGESVEDLKCIFNGCNRELCELISERYGEAVSLKELSVYIGKNVRCISLYCKYVFIGNLKVEEVCLRSYEVVEVGGITKISECNAALELCAADGDSHVIGYDNVLTVHLDKCIEVGEGGEYRIYKCIEVEHTKLIDVGTAESDVVNFCEEELCGLLGNYLYEVLEVYVSVICEVDDILSKCLYVNRCEKVILDERLERLSVHSGNDRLELICGVVADNCLESACLLDNLSDINVVHNVGESDGIDDLLSIKVTEEVGVADNVCYLFNCNDLFVDKCLVADLFHNVVYDVGIVLCNYVNTKCIDKRLCVACNNGLALFHTDSVEYFIRRNFVEEFVEEIRIVCEHLTDVCSAYLIYKILEVDVSPVIINVNVCVSVERCLEESSYVSIVKNDRLDSVIANKAADLILVENVLLDDHVSGNTVLRDNRIKRYESTVKKLLSGKVKTVSVVNIEIVSGINTVVEELIYCYAEICKRLVEIDHSEYVSGRDEVIYVSAVSDVCDEIICENVIEKRAVREHAAYKVIISEEVLNYSVCNEKIHLTLKDSSDNVLINKRICACNKDLDNLCREEEILYGIHLNESVVYVGIVDECIKLCGMLVRGHVCLDKIHHTVDLDDLLYDRRIVSESHELRLVICNDSLDNVIVCKIKDCSLGNGICQKIIYERCVLDEVCDVLIVKNRTLEILVSEKQLHNLVIDERLDSVCVNCREHILDRNKIDDLVSKIDLREHIEIEILSYELCGKLVNDSLEVIYCDVVSHKRTKIVERKIATLCERLENILGDKLKQLVAAYVTVPEHVVNFVRIDLYRQYPILKRKRVCVVVCYGDFRCRYGESSGAQAGYHEHRDDHHNGEDS